MISTSAVHGLYRFIAQNRRCAAAAAMVRNQCDHVVRYHFGGSFRTCEQAEEQLMRTVGPHVRHFADVGANIGRFAAGVLRYSPSDCSGILVEPSISALSMLKARFPQDPRIDIIEAAAGERLGQADFYEEPLAGEASTLLAGAVRGPGRWRTVPITTLDEEVGRRGWHDVSLVKIDAEGYDLRVMEGAAALLRRQAIGVMQFEYNVSWKPGGCLLANAIELLLGHGYTLFLVRRDGLHRPNYQRYGEYFAYSNYLAVSPAWSGIIRALVRGRY